MSLINLTPNYSIYDKCTNYFLYNKIEKCYYNELIGLVS